MSGALQKREALLDAGAALAEEHGLAGVSVNMVVARAGVAKGTFYVHFKDRAGASRRCHSRLARTRPCRTRWQSGASA